MGTLTFNDGTRTEGSLLETETRLFLYFNDRTMADAFAIVNDPEKTKTITADQGSGKVTVEGYRTLKSISAETGGMIEASLVK